MDILNYATKYSNTIQTTIAGTLASVFLYYFGDDLLRYIRMIIFLCGYQKGCGKGVIPGPWGDTRFTRFSHGSILATEWREKYGPVYRIFCGSIPEFVVNSPEDVKILYAGDSRVHGKTINTSFGHYMGEVLGKSVGFLDRDDWKRLRIHTDPHWTAAMSKDSIPSMITDTQEWISRFPSMPITKHDPDGKSFTVEAMHLQSELPFKMIARRLFGEMMSEELFQELFALNKYHERIMAKAFLVGKLEQWKLFSIMPTEANRDNWYFQKHWAALLHREAKKAKDNGTPNAVSTMYDIYKAGDMSFAEFSHTVDEILFTNFDGATMSVAWIVTLMAQYPNIQARLVEELTRVVNDETLGPNRTERLTNYMSKANNFLHYCALEAARLHPVLYFALPENLHEPKVLGGYYLPKNASIIIDAFTINRTAPIWGEDRLVFNPDRFYKLQPSEYRYSLWRFGMGPRKCVGQYFGDKMVKSCLVEILAHYEVTAFGDLGIRRDKFVSCPAATLRFKPREKVY